MSNYLAVCDLDDTLLTGKKTITRKSRKIIRKWCDEGNYFCINTGRPYPAAIQYHNRLGLNMPMICDNGANIYFPKSQGNWILIKNHISQERFLEFYREAKDYICGVFCQCQTKMVTDNVNVFPSWLIHDELGNPLIEGPIEKIVDESLPLPNIKVKEGAKEAFEKILNKYTDIGYRYWGEYESLHAYELFNSGASKGNALKKVQEILKIENDKTYAFGDQKNDLSMIEAAYYGVVMINANDEIKEISNYVSEFDYNHDGVAKYLKRYAK